MNTGSITNFSSLIWASYFQNSGTFFAAGGAISLQQAQSAVLTNGAMLAQGGAISLAGSSLLISNHVLQAARALTLSAVNYLDDGSLLSGSADSISNKNTGGFGIPDRSRGRSCQSRYTF